MLKPITLMYPVIPARDEDERRHFARSAGIASATRPPSMA